MSTQEPTVYMPVFEPHTPSDKMADHITPVEQAVELVKKGRARFINRGKAIRLNEESPHHVRQRGRSLSVNERLMVAYVNLYPAAVAVIDGWQTSDGQHRHGWVEQHRAILRHGRTKQNRIVRRRKWTVRDEKRYTCAPLISEHTTPIDGYALHTILTNVVMAVRRQCQ